MNAEMLYRYCSMIFIIPSQHQWSLFHLADNGSTGAVLPYNGQAAIQPGNYIVLDQGRQVASMNTSFFFFFFSNIV